MKQEIPKKIAIIGVPGSGKSTLACKMGKLMNIPVHHLDTHLFIKDIKRDQKGFISIQQKLVDQDSWIIEGCSIKTLEMRFTRADIVIYLRFSRILCAWRVIKRSFTIDQKLSNSGCASSINWELLKYIWNFEKEKNKRIEELKNLYPQVKVEVFHTPREVKNFLRNLQ